MLQAAPEMRSTVAAVNTILCLVVKVLTYLTMPVDPASDNMPMQVSIRTYSALRGT